MKATTRIHPTISLHSKANTQWSYSDPPLDRLPADLECLYAPDPGWPWLQWTWTDMDLHMLAALTGDTTRDVLGEGWEYPPFGWILACIKPNDEERRTISLLLLQHPKVAEWMRLVGERARTTRTVRAWNGRRHVFSPLDTNIERKACQWAIEAGMQAIFNHTFLAIKARYGAYAIYKYGRSNGMVWAIDGEVWMRAKPGIKELVVRPAVVSMEFPATFTEVWP